MPLPFIFLFFLPTNILLYGSKKLNYISEHYAAIARKSHIFKDEHIMDRAKENLEIIGKVYDYE